ncbi:unnamed protein product [Porites evermanni]|uniref:Uncharacterized protein n=1 Tax=Porites evermanni TaxID=104178 RepID=A0ABN8M5T3_9CNID|nr:unnamed protein product [Porites evermanni]
MVQDSVVKSVITATSTKTIYDLKYTKLVKAFQALMLGKEYYVDNGFLTEKPVHRHHLEKIRVLASHGSVITIKRDAQVRDLHNKYTVEPMSLAVDQSEVWVDE